MVERLTLADKSDWFEFEVARPAAEPDEGQLGSKRFALPSLLDGRMFEEFYVDVDSGDPVVGVSEILETLGLLEFAGIGPVLVRAYPLTQQVAGKLRAYTRPHSGAHSIRVRNSADLLLIASEVSLDGRSLLEAIRATLEDRSTHAIPQMLPASPARWRLSFRRLMEELELGWDDLDEATEAAQGFFNPILPRTDAGK